MMTNREILLFEKWDARCDKLIKELRSQPHENTRASAILNAHITELQGCLRDMANEDLFHNNGILSKIKKLFKFNK